MGWIIRVFVMIFTRILCLFWRSATFILLILNVLVLSGMCQGICIRHLQSSN